MHAQSTLPISCADILAGALISAAPEIMQIERLAPEIRAQIIAGRLEGFRPVSVRWPTGMARCRDPSTLCARLANA